MLEKPTLLDLHRIWVELEDQENAVPEPLDDTPGSPTRANALLQQALCAEIDEVRHLVARYELRTFEHVAIALDMILEYDVPTRPHPDDRVMLGQLVEALGRLAPSVKMRWPGSLDRKRPS